VTGEHDILIFEKIPVENFIKHLKGELVMDVLKCVFWLSVGFIIGYVVIAVFTKSIKYIGSLRMDASDPDDGPYLFLELETDVEELSRKKYVILKINTDDFIPHE
jgi:hypothetical protein